MVDIELVGQWAEGGRVSVEPGSARAKEWLAARGGFSDLSTLLAEAERAGFVIVHNEHSQVTIEHEGKSARVDEAMAPLILALWQRGFDTVASCSGWTELRGKAYVAFHPHPEHAEKFRQAAGTSRRDVWVVSEEDVAEAGDTPFYVPVGTVMVPFPSSRIPALVEQFRNGGRLLASKPGPSYHGRLPKG